MLTCNCTLKPESCETCNVMISYKASMEWCNFNATNVNGITILPLENVQLPAKHDFNYNGVSSG